MMVWLLAFVVFILGVVVISVGWSWYQRSRRGEAGKLKVTATRPPSGSEETFADPSLPLGERRPFRSLFDPAEVTLSVIVPAYNEEERLGSMMDECLTDLEAGGMSYEVMVVDDGSRDRTADVAYEYTRRFGAEKVRVLRLQKNCGKGGAVKKGVLRARGEYVLMADADGATRFADYSKLLDAMKKVEKDRKGVVIGSRYHLSSKTNRTAFRKLASKGFNLFVEIVGGVRGIRDTQCGFKLFSRQAAKLTFPSQHLERWAFDVELLFLAQEARVPIHEVPVQWAEIPGSKLSVLKATWNMARDIARMRYMYLTGAWTLA